MNFSFKWLRPVRRIFGCDHVYELTGRCRTLFIFTEQEWQCTKCNKKETLFLGLDPNKPNYGREDDKEDS